MTALLIITILVGVRILAEPFVQLWKQQLRRRKPLPDLQPGDVVWHSASGRIGQVERVQYWWNVPGAEVHWSGDRRPRWVPAGVIRHDFDEVTR